MRNLDLSEYPFVVEGPEGESRTMQYKIRDSLANLLFNPALQLGGADLLKQDILARKIMQAEGASILLEDAEYAKVRQSVDVFHGFSRNDVEFVRRVLECPEVKVEVAK